jgi:peroxiredoxin
LQTHAPIYAALGAEVLVIVGQRPEKVADYCRTQRLTLRILVDPDRSVIKRYGVYHRLGLTAFNIARPAVFIIDRAQRIRFMYISRSQSDRPDHETLVTALQKLPPPPPASPRPAADAPPIEPAPP